MRRINRMIVVISLLTAVACNAYPDSDGDRNAGSSAEHSSEKNLSKTHPTLREIGSRGFFTLDGPFAEFDPNHRSVDNSERAWLNPPVFERLVVRTRNANIGSVKSKSK